MTINNRQEEKTIMMGTDHGRTTISRGFSKIEDGIFFWKEAKLGKGYVQQLTASSLKNIHVEEFTIFNPSDRGRDNKKILVYFCDLLGNEYNPMITPGYMAYMRVLEGEIKNLHYLLEKANNKLKVTTHKDFLKKELEESLELVKKAKTYDYSGYGGSYYGGGYVQPNQEED